MATKTGVGMSFETALLFGLLRAAAAVPDDARELIRARLPRAEEILGVFEASELIAALVVIFGSSLVGSVGDKTLALAAATAQQISPTQVPDARWYASLRRPDWEPPGWVFPIMWLVVAKPTQLLALTRVVRARAWTAVAVYCLHLSLGDAWNRVFFGLKRLKLSLVTISTFYATLIATTLLFARVDPSAAKLMLPTLGWVAVASALNFAVVRLNPDAGN